MCVAVFRAHAEYDPASATYVAQQQAQQLNVTLSGQPIASAASGGSSKGKSKGKAADAMSSFINGSSSGSFACSLSSLHTHVLSRESFLVEGFELDSSFVHDSYPADERLCARRAVHLEAQFVADSRSCGCGCC